MSAASVRTRGRRDNLPVFRTVAGKGENRFATEPGRFQVFAEDFLELMVDGKLFLFAALFLRAKQKPFL